MLAASGDGKGSDHPSTESSQTCRKFEFSEILLATDNFDESLVIGKGGFGKVYKGNIINGSSVVVAAIKRLDSMSTQGATEFWAEVEMLSKLRHCHLVSLFGYCNYEKEMILIYEYIPNGTLEDHLHKLGTPLSWLQRLKICIGAARGLDYLHTGTGIEFGVIHRDVKSSNILLHERWAAKISDFGLSKIGPTNQPSTTVITGVKGTFGYFDPSYFTTGKLTRKSDVYAFGVVLMEVLCRKRAVDRTIDEDHWGLVMWAQDSIKEGNLKHIIDSGIRGQISIKCLKEFVQIAEKCLLRNPKLRPTMAEIVVGLNSVLASEEKTSSFFPPDDRKKLDIFPLPSNGENSGRTVVPLPSNGENSGISSFREPSHPCRQFDFPEILLATRNFHESLLIGVGGFGKVYKGNIINGSSVEVAAIKRLNTMSSEGASVFWAEIETLSKLRHYHLVSLLGYCNYEKEMILIYNYLPNGTLEHHLHKLGTPLSWLQRLNICIGAARGLDYLHTGMGIDFVVHRNVNTSTILLHENWEAKISSFALSKIGPANQSLTFVNTLIKGTLGYLDPDYYSTGRLTRKSDVYSFGVVLLEVLCRKRAIERSLDVETWALATWAQQCIKEGNLKHIIDFDIRDQISPYCLQEFIRLVEGCLHSSPKQRPTMAEVVGLLVHIRTIQEKMNSPLQLAHRKFFGRMFDNKRGH
ncbi:nodulation receptor kinase [Lactuca sativa]|uniref:Protein kinase domain-containing protein n=1 Tax=Lactuca sativa TaxID=4236 RepID=A0A9R1V1J5_LACSA|nr:nodulation receptor kinase [Lactuca sativa]KAJ0196628.1 hypothetical protein LSAT_V11C700367300 [Lactuca sativa]